MITVIGSLNMDLVFTTPRAPEDGETILGDRFAQHPGGKGANQAVAAQRMGADVTMIGRVGNDAYGDILLDIMDAPNMDLAPVEAIDGISTGVAAITVDRAGHNRIIVISGANAKLTPDDIDRHRDIIERSSVVLLQLETPRETVRHAVRLAKTAGVYVVLNPAPAQPLPDDMLLDIDLLTPNETELALLSGCPTDTYDERVEAGRVLLARGVGALLITLGEEGAMWMDPTLVATHAAESVDAVDTTAAGDAFNGALVAEIDRLGDRWVDDPLKRTQAIRTAQRAAAIAVTRHGAIPSLPTREEVERWDG